MMEEFTIPDNWVKNKLGEVCVVLTGNTPSKSDLANFGNEIPFIKPPNLQHKSIGQTEEMLSTKGGNKSRLVPENSVLVTCIGNLGRTGLTKQVSAFNQQINAILENECIGGKFIFYQAQSPSFKLQLEALSAATTVAIVNKGKFETINIVIPPLAEQHRIVAKIEELFGDLDKGIETLRNAKEQLKVYRQSVLKYAFEGRLTNPGLEDGELPEGWVVKTFSNVSTKIGDIDHKMPAKVSDGKYPYLSTSNITRENELDFKSAKLISEADFNRLSRKIIPEKGDIIFPRYGTIGRNVLVDTDRKFLISYSCAIIKVNTEVMNPKYLYYFSLSALTRKEIEKHIVETTQANVGISSIKVFKIKYPVSKIEQEIVVQEIESRLSICDKIEESIEQGLQQAEALRQSILKKAFEGKIVPQDPNDEPAHVLLERIKSERAAAQPVKKEKKAKV